MSYLLYLVNKGQIRLLPSQLLIRAAFEPALENFLWGAPRIHGELLMLGYRVSQATVSRYLLAPGRRPTQSWRSFLRNQASAFGQYSETRSRGCTGLQIRPYWAKLMRSATAKVATVSVELRRGLSRQPSAPNARRIGLRSARHELAAMHRVPRLAAVYDGLQQTAQQSSVHRRCGAKPTLRSSGLTKIAITRESACCFFGGPGFEKPQPAQCRHGRNRRENS